MHSSKLSRNCSTGQNCLNVNLPCTTTIEYLYDGFGRKVRRCVDTNDSRDLELAPAQYYAYEGMRRITTVDRDGCESCDILNVREGMGDFPTKKNNDRKPNGGGGETSTFAYVIWECDKPMVANGGNAIDPGDDESRDHTVVERIPGGERTVFGPTDLISEETAGGESAVSLAYGYLQFEVSDGGELSNDGGEEEKPKRGTRPYVRPEDTIEEEDPPVGPGVCPPSEFMMMAEPECKPDGLTGWRNAFNYDVKTARSGYPPGTGSGVLKGAAQLQAFSTLVNVVSGLAVKFAKAGSSTIKWAEVSSGAVESAELALARKGLEGLEKTLNKVDGNNIVQIWIKMRAKCCRKGKWKEEEGWYQCSKTAPLGSIAHSFGFSTWEEVRAALPQCIEEAGLKYKCKKSRR